jgi:NAD(P)-dependent dehydrogenase (short-subunit alcohol dehydrogenase family)
MVTGGARGLGFEFCRAFVQSGCTSVVIIDLRESDTIEAAAELSRFAVSLGFSEEDINFIGISCDVSSEESVITAYNMIMGKFGRIDAVVASAGVVENYSALDYPADRVKFLFDINFHGVLYTAREAARRMIPNGGGSVILISSMSASIVNIPQAQAPYNASKAAVKHLASSLAVEWAKDGVRVNCISPGYMLTKLTKQVLSKDPALKATWETMTPMGRMGDPSDLSGAVVLLASDASKFITGTEIKVDGGYCAI